MAGSTNGRHSAHSFMHDAPADAAGSGYDHSQAESPGDRDAIFFKYVDKQLAIQAEQHAAWQKLNQEFGNMGGRVEQVESTLANVVEQVEHLNVVKEELEEHVEGMREHLTAAVERMERRREQDFENQQRQIAELKRKVEAQHENGGYKRPCAAPTKQGKPKNADEREFIALPVGTKYLSYEKMMELGLRSRVRKDSKYLTVNSHENIELKRIGNRVHGKLCRGLLHTKNKAGEIVHHKVQFLVTDQCDRRNKFKQDVCQWR